LSKTDSRTFVAHNTAITRFVNPDNLVRGVMLTRSTIRHQLPQVEAGCGKLDDRTGKCLGFGQVCATGQEEFPDLDVGIGYPGADGE